MGSLLKIFVFSDAVKLALLFCHLFFLLSQNKYSWSISSPSARARRINRPPHPQPPPLILSPAAVFAYSHCSCSAGRKCELTYCWFVWHWLCRAIPQKRLQNQLLEPSLGFFFFFAPPCFIITALAFCCQCNYKYTHTPHTGVQAPGSEESEAPEILHCPKSTG